MSQFRCPCGFEAHHWIRFVFHVKRMHRPSEICCGKRQRNEWALMEHAIWKLLRQQAPQEHALILVYLRRGNQSRRIKLAQYFRA